jgi:hypothetical protein
MKRYLILTYAFLLIWSCSDPNRGLEKVSEDVYAVWIDDTTKFLFSYYDKSEDNSLNTIYQFTIRDGDTVWHRYAFYQNGLLDELEFKLSKTEKTDFYRYKVNGNLAYKAELEGSNMDGYSVRYKSDTTRESLSVDGRFYFIKRDDTIDLARPRDFSLDRLNADSFAYSISNDLKDFQQLSFNPNRLRLVFLSAQKDLDFQANYNLETNSTITDTVSLEKFEKGEKVYVIVNYFGDPIIDRREDWDEIHFIVDSIVM